MRILGNINMFFAERERRARSERRDGRAAAPRDRRRDASATARRAASRPTAASPTSSSRPRSGARSAAWRTEVFRDRYGGLKGLRSPDFPLLNRLLGGESPTHGELLSYLFFDREFIEELIRMGQRDARRWLRVGPGPDDPWQIEPLDAFTRTTAAAGARVAARVRGAERGRALRRGVLPATTDWSVRRRPSSRSTSASKPSSSRERVGSSALRCTSPGRGGRELRPRRCAAVRACPSSSAERAAAARPGRAPRPPRRGRR